MPCSVCFDHGHNIRTCQFKDGFITGVNPTNIKQKKQKKQKSVFKDKNQMSLALRDLQELYSDRTKLLENKHKQLLEIKKHLVRFTQDKKFLKNLFIRNSIHNWDELRMKKFLRNRKMINRKPKPLLPIPLSAENKNENNIKMYKRSVWNYNREIMKYKKEIVQANVQSPNMRNKNLRHNHLLYMITHFSRFNSTIKLTDIINHNQQTIILPFQKKKVDDIYNYTKHNRIVRLTKHYNESLEHSTKLPTDIVRIVVSFLI